NSTGEREFDCAAIEYNGFARADVSDGALWTAFWNWFATSNPHVDELVVPGLQQESANLHKSSELILATREVPAFRRPLAQYAGAEELETTLSRNAREKLRRSLREYRTRGELIIEEASTLDAALSYFEALKDLHIRSWTRRGKPHAFRFPFFE